MKKIRLPHGKFCLVDDENYAFLNKFNWFISISGYAYYIHNKSSVMMSRFIMREELKGKENFEIDHINGNPLDNRRENLRVCTHQQNLFNNSKCRKRRCTSIYKGVHFAKETQKWISRITMNHKAYYIGTFNTENEAAFAYNEKAKELFGKFANLNILK